jgi:tetratricopeptide (TPR) repeat protein
MRVAVLLTLLASCGSLRVYAAPCTGAETQLARVSNELTLNSLEAAESDLRALSLSYPDCPQIILQSARLAQAKGDVNQAAELYYRYTDGDPDDSRGLAYFGRYFLEQRDYMRADALSAVAVQKNGADPVALALRGQILIMKGQSQEAQELLEKAIQMDPNDPEPHFQLGEIYDKAKLSPKAVIHFQKVVALNPRDARAWDYLALNLEPMGDLEGAEDAYQRGLRVDQTGKYYDAFLDYNYGRFLAKRNELAASKRHLDKAVALTPQIRAVWYERAKLEMRMHNYQQAQDDAEKAAACTQQGGIIDLQIYSLLSQVYARLGNTALARKYMDLTRETPPPVRSESR